MPVSIPNKPPIYPCELLLQLDIPIFGLTPIVKSKSFEYKILVDKNDTVI